MIVQREEVKGKQQTQAQKIHMKSELISHLETKFEELMQIDGISSEDVMNSLSCEMNRDMVFKAGEGTGQSGSFFFFSHDNRFMIKTLRGNEKATIFRIIDDLINYVKDVKNKTLLAKIYGLYTIKTNLFDDLDVIVMQNIAYSQDKTNPKMVFDLKGSTYKRKTKLADKQFWLKSLNQKKILKDQNFQEINRDCGNSLMELTSGQIDELSNIFKTDSQFLADHNLMDYSLLLVIEQLKVSLNGDQLFNGSPVQTFDYASLNSDQLFKQQKSGEPSINQKFERSFKDYVNLDSSRKDLPRITFKSELRELYFAASPQLLSLPTSMKKSGDFDNFYVSTQVRSKEYKSSQQNYHFGIIDYLQDYNFQKKAERLLHKISKPGKVHDKISCVPPKLYASRFNQFLNEFVLNPNQEKYIYSNRKSYQRDFIKEMISECDREIK